MKRIILLIVLGGVIYLVARALYRLGATTRPPKSAERDKKQAKDKKLSPKEKAVAERKKIIAHAMDKGGQITLAEAYLVSDLEESEVKKLFDQWMQDDVCRMDVDAKGVISYVFLTSDESKLHLSP